MAGMRDKLHGTANTPAFLTPTEVAERLKDLIEQGQYRSGITLGVYTPGDATVVADGRTSLLEDLVPSDLEYVRANSK